MQVKQAGRRLLAGAGIAAGVALVVILLAHLDVVGFTAIRRLELSTIDYRFQLRGTRAGVGDSSSIIIVEISEESFRAFPSSFPWPRSYYAHAVRNLKAAGARAVGIDLILSDPDSKAPEGDRDLREAIREASNVVLAGKRPEDRPEMTRTSLREDFGNMFFDADSALGLVNIRPDADGVYRMYNTAYEVDLPGGARRIVPTFGFAVLNRALGLPLLTAPVPAPGGFRYHGMFIPAYDPASLLINFAGPHRTFRHIPFHDVIDDSSFTTSDEARSGEQVNTFSDPDFGYLRAGTFRDKIVLIGVTVPEQKDVFPVAFGVGTQTGDNLMYGVEIHANLIESVLRGDFLQIQSVLSEAVMVLVLTAVTFLATSRLRSRKSRVTLLVEVYGFLLTCGLILGIGWVAITLFIHHSYVLRASSAFLAVIGGYGTSTVYSIIQERRQRLLIKSMFSTYVSPSVVDELVAHPEKLVLGGRRDELTVLFSDIEGFTTISQHMPPEELVGILNEYLSDMAAVVFKYGGTLDKYEGDAVMAFWGAPVPQQDHALRACLTALEMQGAVDAINRRWETQGKPRIRVRIGINTGVMVVGNLGSEGKFDYTVIGDSVNLCSRLEGANKEYGTGIMASQRTYELVRERILARELDRIAVKGRSEPVTVYELLQTLDRPAGTELEDFLRHFAEGLGHYYRMEWDAASASFHRALRVRPGDRASEVHLKRIEAFRISPPPAGWDGVYIMQTK